MEEDTLMATIPSYVRELPILRDDLATQTSLLQDTTIQECLPLLKGVADPARSPFDFNELGIPRLDKEQHVEFLEEHLSEFPASFVGLDASRPWMVYWALIGLYMLGEDTTEYRSRVVKTFYPVQNSTGGLGGGHGHYSHLAGTYAGLLTLALVGGDEAYELIDRNAMWQWLGRLKQSDGGFQICEGGEEDVRGAYCALVIISLLNLPMSLPPDAEARSSGLELFTDGLGEYLSRCQTYEGGIAASPGNEAHGAYAFCALACLCLCDVPHISLNKFLDVDALLSWLSSRQYAPEGGFAGRTNKVVDGCYSHWIGTCWPLVQAALHGPRVSDDDLTTTDVSNLYSGEGLARYILGCCQAPFGGLRDKPSKRPDSYHTCYNLVGINNVEHVHSYGRSQDNTTFSTVFTWKASLASFPSESIATETFHTGAGVKSLHPIYVIPHDAVNSMRQWSLARPLDTNAAS